MTLKPLQLLLQETNYDSLNNRIHKLAKLLLIEQFKG